MTPQNDEKPKITSKQVLKMTFRDWDNDAVKSEVYDTLEYYETRPTPLRPLDEEAVKDFLRKFEGHYLVDEDTFFSCVEAKYSDGTSGCCDDERIEKTGGKCDCGLEERITRMAQSFCTTFGRPAGMTVEEIEEIISSKKFVWDQKDNISVYRQKAMALHQAMYGGK